MKYIFLLCLPVTASFFLVPRSFLPPTIRPNSRVCCFFAKEGGNKAEEAAADAEKLLLDALVSRGDAIRKNIAAWGGKQQKKRAKWWRRHLQFLDESEVLASWCEDVARLSQHDLGFEDFDAKWSPIMEKASWYLPPPEEANTLTDASGRNMNELIGFIIENMDDYKEDEINLIQFHGLEREMETILFDEEEKQKPMEFLKSIRNDEEYNKYSYIFISLKDDSGSVINVNGDRSQRLQELKRGGLLKSATESRVKEVLEMTAHSIVKLPDAFPFPLPPRISYIVTQPKNAAWNCFMPNQDDKYQAKVISGESGSGKTVMSVLMPMARDSTVLYTKAGDRLQSFKYLDKEEEECIKLVIDILRNEDELEKFNSTRWYDLLYSVTLNILRFGRNEDVWEIAFDLIESALDETKGKDEHYDSDTQAPTAEDSMVFSHWLSSTQAPTAEDRTAFSDWLSVGQPKLKDLTIVFDDVVNIDFAKALVDISRSLRYELSDRWGLANYIDIVVAGTGLERLEKYFPRRMMGTDPRKAIFIRMVRPDLDQFAVEYKYGQYLAVVEASKRGSISSLLTTNARMFYRGVFPMLSDSRYCENLASVDVKLEERLVQMGGIKQLMDFAVRFFLAASPLDQIESIELRRTLLKSCFHHHLQSAKKHLDMRSKVFTEADPITQLAMYEDQCIDLGLLQSEGKTSAALKYLSCLGLTGEVVKNDGDSLEGVTALHLLRRNQVYELNPQPLLKLVNAWPPLTQLGGTNLTTNIIKEFQSSPYPDEIALCNMINECVSKKENFSIIMLQGERTGQGADVLELEAVQAEDGSSFQAKLHLYQCKNTESMSWPVALRSLGVRKAGKNSTKYNTTPRHGLAGYSLAGVKRLCRMIGKKTEISTVELGHRVVVTAESGVPFQNETEIEFPACCKIMPRELLEPTITALGGKKYNADEY